MPPRKVKIKTVPPVVARKRGRPRKIQVAESQKILITRHHEETNRVALAPDDMQGRIQELANLAKKQSYLTFNDINNEPPEGMTDADEQDAIRIQVRQREPAIIK